MKKKTWQIKQHDEQAVSAMAAELNLLPSTVKLLFNRGYTGAEEIRSFLAKDNASFHDPFLLPDAALAIARINLAKERDEKVTIYGDYDVDGVTATSILFRHLTSMGIRCDYYIPGRVDEGYGVNNDALRTISGSGSSLVITVDTGITAIEELEYAKTLSLDVIITDHHECREMLPEACAVVNPKRRDSKYPFKDLAGVGVVFKLICALEAEKCSTEQLLAMYADIVAIGTVADVMPLVDENRLIVNHGLIELSSSKNFGIAEMLRLTSSDKRGNLRKITSSTISYGIAPRINAAGRITDANRAVEFFLADSPAKAKLIAEELCEINVRRQVEENIILNQALEKINSSLDFEKDKVIVLSDDNWHNGIIGIVASRITDRFNLPSILICFDGDIGKGSARSIKGINIVDMMEKCNRNLLKYGGHELAAGLSISREMLGDFIKEANEYVTEKMINIDNTIIFSIDCELAPEQINKKAYYEMNRLEPFGLGNTQPVFVLKNVVMGSVIPLGADKHVKFKVTRNGVAFEAIYFSISSKEFRYIEGDEIDVAFNLGVNEFQNASTLQLLIRDVHYSNRVNKAIADSIARYAEIKGDVSHPIPESLIPKKEDFQKVYGYFRKEITNIMEMSSCGTLSYYATIISQSGVVIDVCKLRLILDIFEESGLLSYEAVGNSITAFVMLDGASKVDLDNSELLTRLKANRVGR